MSLYPAGKWGGGKWGGPPSTWGSKGKNDQNHNTNVFGDQNTSSQQGVFGNQNTQNRTFGSRNKTFADQNQSEKKWGQNEAADNDWEGAENYWEGGDEDGEWDEEDVDWDGEGGDWYGEDGDWNEEEGEDEDGNGEDWDEDGEWEEDGDWEEETNTMVSQKNWWELADAKTGDKNIADVKMADSSGSSSSAAQGNSGQGNSTGGGLTLKPRANGPPSSQPNAISQPAVGSQPPTTTKPPTPSQNLSGYANGGAAGGSMWSSWGNKTWKGNGGSGKGGNPKGNNVWVNPGKNVWVNPGNNVWINPALKKNETIGGAVSSTAPARSSQPFGENKTWVAPGNKTWVVPGSATAQKTTPAGTKLTSTNLTTSMVLSTNAPVANATPNPSPPSKNMPPDINNKPVPPIEVPTIRAPIFPSKLARSKAGRRRKKVESKWNYEADYDEEFEIKEYPEGVDNWSKLGTLNQMCANDEIELRTQARQLAVFEKAKECTDRYDMIANPELCVKQYQRSAAEKVYNAWDIRSFECLKRSKEYLFDKILEADNYTPEEFVIFARESTDFEVWAFLNNRCRGIRVDYQLQQPRSLYLKESLRFHEQNLRLVLLWLLILIREGTTEKQVEEDVFDKAVSQTCDPIIAIYDAWFDLTDEKIKFRSKPFIMRLVLCFLVMVPDKFTEFLMKLRDPVVDHPLVGWAIRAVSTFQAKDYGTFLLQYYRNADLLTAICLKNAANYSRLMILITRVRSTQMRENVPAHLLCEQLVLPGIPALKKVCAAFGIDVCPVCPLGAIIPGYNDENDGSGYEAGNWVVRLPYKEDRGFYTPSDDPHMIDAFTKRMLPYLGTHSKDNSALPGISEWRKEIKFPRMRCPHAWNLFEDALERGYSRRDIIEGKLDRTDAEEDLGSHAWIQETDRIVSSHSQPMRDRSSSERTSHLQQQISTANNAPFVITASVRGSDATPNISARRGPSGVYVESLPSASEPSESDGESSDEEPRDQTDQTGQTDAKMSSQKVSEGSPKLKSISDSPFGNPAINNNPAPGPSNVVFSSAADPCASASMVFDPSGGFKNNSVTSPGLSGSNKSINIFGNLSPVNATAAPDISTTPGATPAPPVISAPTENEIPQRNPFTSVIQKAESTPNIFGTHKPSGLNMFATQSAATGLFATPAAQPTTVVNIFGTQTENSAGKNINQFTCGHQAQAQSIVTSNPFGIAAVQSNQQLIQQGRVLGQQMQGQRMQHGQIQQGQQGKRKIRGGRKFGQMSKGLREQVEEVAMKGIKRTLVACFTEWKDWLQKKKIREGTSSHQRFYGLKALFPASSRFNSKALAASRNQHGMGGSHGAIRDQTYASSHDMVIEFSRKMKAQPPKPPKLPETTFGLSQIADILVYRQREKVSAMNEKERAKTNNQFIGIGSFETAGSFGSRISRANPLHRGSHLGLPPMPVSDLHPPVPQKLNCAPAKSFKMPLPMEEEDFVTHRRFILLLPNEEEQYMLSTAIRQALVCAGTVEGDRKMGTIEGQAMAAPIGTGFSSKDGISDPPPVSYKRPSLLSPFGVSSQPEGSASQWGVGSLHSYPASPTRSQVGSVCSMRSMASVNSAAGSVFSMDGDVLAFVQKESIFSTQVFHRAAEQERRASALMLWRRMDTQDWTAPEEGNNQPPPPQLLGQASILGYVIPEIVNPAQILLTETIPAMNQHMSLQILNLVRATNVSKIHIFFVMTTRHVQDLILNDYYSSSAYDYDEFQCDQEFDAKFREEFPEMRAKTSLLHNTVEAGKDPNRHVCSAADNATIVKIVSYRMKEFVLGGLKKIAQSPLYQASVKRLQQIIQQREVQVSCCGIHDADANIIDVSSASISEVLFGAGRATSSSPSWPPNDNAPSPKKILEAEYTDTDILARHSILPADTKDATSIKTYALMREFELSTSNKVHYFRMRNVRRVSLRDWLCQKFQEIFFSARPDLTSSLPSALDDSTRSIQGGDLQEKARDEFGRLYFPFHIDYVQGCWKKTLESVWIEVNRMSIAQQWAPAEFNVDSTYLTVRKNLPTLFGHRSVQKLFDKELSYSHMEANMNFMRRHLAGTAGEEGDTSVIMQLNPKQFAAEYGPDLGQLIARMQELRIPLKDPNDLVALVFSNATPQVLKERANSGIDWGNPQQCPVSWWNCALKQIENCIAESHRINFCDTQIQSGYWDQQSMDANQARRTQYSQVLHHDALNEQIDEDYRRLQLKKQRRNMGL